VTLRLGDVAPDFTTDSTQGPLSLHAWLGDSWGVLFSHPGDFTPVCTTELGTAARLAEEFARRDTKLLGLSVDSVESHLAWEDDIMQTQGAAVGFPIIADEDRHVSSLYDMIHPHESETATVRSLFVIGADKRVKLILVYPMSTGRNFDEVLRVIDSLQLTARHKVSTPANWRAGEDVLISGSVSDDEARQTYPQGWNAPRPYLHIVPQPRP
jgi:alkyl hydroperoxide reductase subunit AhpC